MESSVFLFLTGGESLLALVLMNLFLCE